MDLDSLARAWRARRARADAELTAWAHRAREDAERASRVLAAEFGATEVWLYGSLVWGRPHVRSDVDLAVRGVPRDRHYAALARACEIIGAPVDLVDLGSCPPSLAARIVSQGTKLHG